MNGIAIGVDVGATKIASAAVTPEGKVVAARQTRTDAGQGPDAVIARMVTEIEALASARNETVIGVGIGVPGLVNPGEGLVIRAVNMGWQEVPLRSQVQERLGMRVPVYVENDLRTAARGEAMFGAGRGVKDFVLMTLGSGLGSAAMVDGRVVHGARFFASEAGHLALDVNGRRCKCGLKGCAETVLSGPGLIAETREILRAGIASTLQDRDTLTPQDILYAARQEDAAALAAMDKLGEWLGIVMATASVWLNPARFIIGGGLGLAAFDLIARRALAEYGVRALAASEDGAELVRSQVESSAVGAAALVLAG